MTEERMALLEPIEKRGDTDLVRELLACAAERPMAVEVDGLCGAVHGERSLARSNQRNGYRERAWDTRAGRIEPKIPKLGPPHAACRMGTPGKGSCFPAIPEPRRTAERALAAAIREAYVHGVSTRAVDGLAKAMGLVGVSRSEVSRVCQEIDGRVGAFLDRPIEGEWPYLWLDATYVQVRGHGRIASAAAIIATAANSDGRREVLGMATGPSEAEPFWTDFLRSLADRGLALRRLLAASPLGIGSRASWPLMRQAGGRRRPQGPARRRHEGPARHPPALPRAPPRPPGRVPCRDRMIRLLADHGCATCSAVCPPASGQWSRRCCVPSSPRTQKHLPASSGARSPTACASASPRRPSRWTGPSTTSWPTAPSPGSTGHSSPRPTPWSGRTGRSSAAPTACPPAGIAGPGGGRHLPERQGRGPAGRRHPARAERRVGGGPPLHDPGNHAAKHRYRGRQPACRGRPSFDRPAPGPTASYTTPGDTTRCSGSGPRH